MRLVNSPKIKKGAGILHSFQEAPVLLPCPAKKQGKRPLFFLLDGRLPYA